MKGNRPYVLSLVVLNLLFFGDALFTSLTFYYRDICNFHHPLKQLVTEAYSRGEWPLWNPYAQFGQPLLANPNSAAVYPTQLLFHFLPFSFAFDLNLVCHCLIGGIGAFCLARSLSLSPFASLVAAIAYNFNGVVLSFVNLPLLAPIAGLFPWLAFLLKQTIDRPGRLVVAAFSLAVALFLLSFEPITSGAVLLFLLVFGVYCLVTRPAGTSSRRVALALLIVLVSGFCLAGIQVLPTLELVRNSARQAGLSYAKASFWSLNPITLAQMLFPGVWTDTFTLKTLSSGFWSDVFSESREAYIVSCYSGLLGLMLALFGVFFSERRRLKWTLGGVSLAALLLALGKFTPIYSVLFDYLPPFRFGRYPVKYLLAAALCLALFAGLGADQLPKLRARVQAPNGKRRFVFLLLLIAGLLAASGLLATPWFWSKAGALVVTGNLIHLTYRNTQFVLGHQEVQRSVLYLWSVLLGGTGLILIAWKLRIRASWLLALAALSVFIDLMTNRSINPTVDSELYGQSPVAEWLWRRGAEEGPFRIYHWSSGQGRYEVLGNSDVLAWYYVFRRLTAMPYTASGDHVQYSSFTTIDRLDTAASQEVDSRLEEKKTADDRLRYLAGLNVRYVLSMEALDNPQLEPQVSFPVNSDQPLRIYRLKTAVPRSYLEDSGGEVKVTSYTSGQVGLSVTARKRSVLVLLDSYYPGWRVWVDGREEKVQPVNRAFRGVIVQPGRHQVAFRYEPKSFRYGLALTLLTIAAWFASLIFLCCRRKPKLQTAPEASRERVGIC